VSVNIAWDAWLPAPAKLNLFLHVVGRRGDGYHLLETLFRLIDLNDRLRFTPRADGEVRLATPLPGVDAENDLCTRAARALRQTARVRTGVDIHLDKHIPMGGGLGGGSSDAATTLLALNRLWGVDYPPERLIELALPLGADVPLFVFGRNAYAEGVGERLTEAKLPPAWYVVLVPPVSVPTPAAFAAPELTRNTKTVKISGFSAGSKDFAAHDGAWPAWDGGWGRNDLEPVVCSRFPEVSRHLTLLKERAGNGVPVRMSGSGACVFAELENEETARALASGLPGAGLPGGVRAVVAQGLDVHPLQT
jgi:4-diphosphocytidyl-2-C-methyl-D-erythritol kinase